jgi:hypothetical protein
MYCQPVPATNFLSALVTIISKIFDPYHWKTYVYKATLLSQFYYPPALKLFFPLETY